MKIVEKLLISTKYHKLFLDICQEIPENFKIASEYEQIIIPVEQRTIAGQGHFELIAGLLLIYKDWR